MPADEWSRRQRERILRVAGNPADFGAPAPGDDLLVAGLSLCQDYLAQVRDGSIVCRPGIASIDGMHRHVHRRLDRQRVDVDHLRDRLRP